MNANDNREWVMVPRVASKEMHAAFWAALPNGVNTPDWLNLGFTAMLAATPPPPTTGDGGQRRATDAEISDWLNRHNLRGALPGSDARCAFEDAQSLCATPGEQACSAGAKESAKPAFYMHDICAEILARGGAQYQPLISTTKLPGYTTPFYAAAAHPDPGSVADAQPSPASVAGEAGLCDDCRQPIVGPAFCYQCVERRTDERGAASRRIALEQSNAMIDKIVRGLEITSSGVDVGADKNPTDYAKGVAKGWDDAVNALKRAVQAQRCVSTLLALNTGESTSRATDLGRFA